MATDMPIRLCAGCHNLQGGERFRISPAMVKALRRLAHGQKGLDEEAYRAHVRAVGGESTLELSRDQHAALVQRLVALPDCTRVRSNARRA